MFNFLKKKNKLNSDGNLDQKRLSDVQNKKQIKTSDSHDKKYIPGKFKRKVKKEILEEFQEVYPVLDKKHIKILSYRKMKSNPKKFSKKKSIPPLTINGNKITGEKKVFTSANKTKDDRLEDIKKNIQE